MPNIKGESNSKGELVKFVKILKSGGSFLGETLIKREPNKVKWEMKFVQK